MIAGTVAVIAIARIVAAISRTVTAIAIIVATVAAIAVIVTVIAITTAMTAIIRLSARGRWRVDEGRCDSDRRQQTEGMDAHRSS